MVSKINIRRVNNGWICEVGCQTIVFTDPKQMTEAFKDLMTNQDEARRKWVDYETHSIEPAPPPTATEAVDQQRRAMTGIGGGLMSSMYDGIKGLTRGNL